MKTLPKAALKHNPHPGALSRAGRWLREAFSRRPASGYPDYFDVFENKSKPIEKLVRAILLTGLAISLSVAVLLQFGVIRGRGRPAKANAVARPAVATESAAYTPINGN